MYHFLLCRPVLELRAEFLTEGKTTIPLEEFNLAECIDIRPVHDIEIPRLVEAFLKIGYDSDIPLTVVVKPLMVIVGDKDDPESSWEEVQDRPFIVDGRHRICALKKFVMGNKPLGYTGDMKDFPVPVRVLRQDTPDECLIRIANGSS